jgi:hypothetical protein
MTIDPLFPVNHLSNWEGPGSDAFQRIGGQVA